MGILKLTLRLVNEVILVSNKQNQFIVDLCCFLCFFLWYDLSQGSRECIFFSTNVTRSAVAF